MIPFLTTTPLLSPASTLSLNTTTTTTTTPTWKATSTGPEDLPTASPSTAAAATATTTSTEATTSAAVRTLLSTLLEHLTSSEPSLDGSLHNLTQSPSAGEDVVVVVDGDGGGVGGGNTPLNAPQPSLEPVSQQTPSLDRYPELGELGWIIPISVVCVLVMVALAMALYHGVRKLELRMLSWCYRNCACCCAPGGGRGGRRVLRGEQYDTLSEETGRKETVRLRDFREGSPGYGMTRNLPKEYSPMRDSCPALDDDGS